MLIKLLTCKLSLLIGIDIIIISRMTNVKIFKKLFAVNRKLYWLAEFHMTGIIGTW